MIIFNNKETFDNYFKENIFPLCNNGILLSTTKIQEKHGRWYRNIVKFYGNLENFCNNFWLKQYSYYFYWKERFDALFFLKIKNKNIPISYALLCESWLKNWYNRLIHNKKYYKSLEDFCIQHNLTHIHKWEKNFRFNSYEKFMLFFENNIRPKIKYNKMLSHKQFRKFKLYNWINAMWKYWYYKSLEDFCNKHWFIYSKPNREIIISKFSDIWKIDDYFFKKISPILWNQALTIDFIKQNWLLSWYRAITRYKYYKWLEDFCNKHNIQYNKYWLQINNKEEIFIFYQSNILPMLKNERLTLQFLTKNWFHSWYLKCRIFYWGLRQFISENKIPYIRKWDYFKNKEFHLQFYNEKIKPLLWNSKLTFKFLQKNKFIPWYRAIKKFKLYKDFDHFKQKNKIM